MSWDVNTITGYRIKPMNAYVFKNMTGKEKFPTVPSKYEIANGNGGKRGNHFSS